MCLGRYARLKEQEDGRNRKENVSKINKQTKVNMAEPQLGGSER